jgi:uncharacterized protein YcnI
MKKIIAVFSSIIGICTLAVVPAFAHVVVKPAQVGTAAFQTFTMGVPNEKDNPTIAVRLMIPDGLKYVSPNVKPGWTINVKKSGTGEDAKVTEIDWIGGSIPVGQRDDFIFSAQVPSKETLLKWDAYQVYQNGETVAWAHEPSKNPDDDSAPPPHSLTQVVNDLADTSSSHDAMRMDKSEEHSDGASEMNVVMFISGAALILSVIALGMQLTKRKK